MRSIRLPRALLPCVSLSHRHHLPKKPGVYYVIDRWKIEYVGLSKNLNERWTSTSRPHHKLNTFWGRPMLRIHYAALPAKIIGNYEAVEIKRYNPRHNNRYEPIIPSLDWSIYLAQCWFSDVAIGSLIFSPLIFVFAGVFRG